MLPGVLIQGCSRYTFCMQKKFVIGNWKMYPSTLREAKELFTKIRNSQRSKKNTEVVVCPPSVYLSDLGKISGKGGVRIGAQDAFWEYEGSYTGNISASMIKHLGAEYVILGHSERRVLGETSEQVSMKVSKVLKEGLSPIVCIGERERDSEGAHLGYIENELSESIKGVRRKDISKVVIAYEPVWAIGKSAKNAMSPEDIRVMSIYIRKILSNIYGRKLAENVPILYGGSVDSTIVRDIIIDGGVDGVLVGKQSRRPDEFQKIIEIINNV